MAKPKKKVKKPIVTEPDAVSEAHRTEKDRPTHETTTFGKAIASQFAEEIVHNAKKKGKS